jgi:hypothetical protein
MLFFAIPRKNCKNKDKEDIGGMLVEKMDGVPFYSSGFDLGSGRL